MDLNLVLPLDRSGARLELAGGKGAALASLAAAGLPVPVGFLLTTAAYRGFVAENGLQPAILNAAEGLAGADLSAVERAETTIRALFEGGAMPRQIAAAVGQAYAALGDDGAVAAVRSSATAEDLPGLSFAGQQESFLNVRGQAALLDAVRRCWASLWTARALRYRQRMGIDQTMVAMGVVVQVMVPAELSGVLFTANPTSGERTELLINASYGLGAAIVGGEVTPDTYLLDKASLAMKAVTLGTKAVMTVPTKDGLGTVTAAVPEADRGRRALPEPLLRELAELGARAEQHFGGVPQDVEWAVAEGRCWLLQSRPITNLPPPPLRDVRWEPPRPGSAWIRRQVVEHLPGPLSPLFEELYLHEGLERSVDAILGVMGLSVDRLMERPFFATVNGYAYISANINLNWTTAPILARACLQGIPVLFRRGIPNWREEALPAYLATIERWKQLDLASASDQQLLQGLRELAWADARYWFASAFAIGVAKLTDALLGSFLSVAAPGRRLTSGLYLRGFPSKTLEAEVELATIADQIRGSDELRALVVANRPDRLLEALVSAPGGTAVLASFRGYLERYGHQIYSLDFAEPTQADDPGPILVSLRALVQRPARDVRARQAEMARERHAATLRTARSFDPLRRRLFRRVLGWAQQAGPYREAALFYVGAAWPALRRLALELGRRLATAGSLGAAEDVFYLESAELATASTARAAGQARPDLARLARERRELRAARQRLHAPPSVPPDYRFKLGPIDLADREAVRHNTAEDTTLRGFAVSPGRVTAAASLILSPADFDQMKPGTILVCPTTTPAWTPLFAQAGGLVTDIGGVLAHGSIVAREYGIPAVMGTGTATQRIVSGQQITIDGDAGTVTL